MKLVIAGDLLDEAVTIYLKQHKMSYIVEKQLRIEEATHQRLQLHLQTRPIILVGDGSPGQHALGIGGQGTDTRRKAITHHQRSVAIKERTDLFFVGL
ncbi:hypothetical protein D3C76_1298220 [compost metagenome]